MEGSWKGVRLVVGSLAWLWIGVKSRNVGCFQRFRSVCSGRFVTVGV